MLHCTINLRAQRTSVAPLGGFPGLTAPCAVVPCARACTEAEVQHRQLAERTADAVKRAKEVAAQWQKEELLLRCVGVAVGRRLLAEAVQTCC